MRGRAFLLVAALMTFLTVPVAGQIVADFEDAPVCDNTRPNMGVYAGIDFMSQWTCYASPQPPFNPASGTNRVYAVDGSANASSAFFSFLGGPVNFLGAYFSGSANVVFNLFLGGSLMASSGSLLTTGTPTFLSAGYAGPVDKVQVVGGDVNWVMDDVTYSVVPEPGAILLLGTGLLGIFGVSLLRKKETLGD